MQQLTHHERLYLQALSDNGGLANRDVHMKAVASFDASMSNKLSLCNHMISGLVARGLVQKAPGESARLTDVGRLALADHPFDTPCYFGEDGDVFVVRGDISAEDAARRMTEHDDAQTGEARAPIDPISLVQTMCVHLVGVREEDNDWQLQPKARDHDPLAPGAQVWVFYDW